MDLAKSLTPKDTEEIRPGLFIQRWRGKYRAINPVAWNGKVRVKEQLKAAISLKTIVWFAILFLLVWSYRNDVGEYQRFYEEVTENPIAYCNAIQTLDGYSIGGILLKETNDIRTNIRPDN